jgi:epoxyqueuosine reductase
MPPDSKTINYEDLLREIEKWSKELGFQQLGISNIELNEHDKHLNDWLAAGFHGDMDYMFKHGSKRSHPEQLVEHTCRVISVRMDYNPPDCELSDSVLDNPELGFISRYALGRDYHKVMRKRLQKLSDKITTVIGDFGYRVFVDSAPVLEKALAEKAGLGWIGKHTNLINKKSGSWFFLGEIYTDIPLPISHEDSEKEKSDNHCGSCTTCIDICPTKAIIKPYTVDARRCISYLTIELHGSIPIEFRKDMGNRIYGCDDCQLCCPWNRFSQDTTEQDFFARQPLDAPNLIELFNWNEQQFLKNTEGSAIRRIGYLRWIRNIAVALGNTNDGNANKSNANRSEKIKQALQQKKTTIDDTVVLEHINWALKEQVISSK